MSPRLVTHQDTSTAQRETTSVEDWQGGESLPDPLAVICLPLRSLASAKNRFPAYRLGKLVGARLELDEHDTGMFPAILGVDILGEAFQTVRPFSEHLRQVVVRYGLEGLFYDDGHALYHHGVRPTGYDFRRDEVIPINMATWHAEYRGVSNARQMMAATIIWLYRGGKDNVWLRRVPCTWYAPDALDHMKTHDTLRDWLRLFALYPGW